MKKILIILSMIIICIFVSSCIDKEGDMFDSFVVGDFICTTWDCNEHEIKIIGLSDEGKEKEVLIVPNRLDNKEVKSIGSAFGIDSSGPFEISNAKKVYYCSSLRVITEIDYSKNENAVDVFIATVLGDAAFSLSKEYLGYSYVCYDVFCKCSNYAITSSKLKPSNVSYYIDDECYFVDNVENDLITVIPPTPYKEGYRFDGWYKDMEYTDRWDFSKDIVPYDKDTFIETKLYAKWV